MWKDFNPRALTRAELAARVAELEWTSWKPSGIVLHNTAAPTLAQWAESGPRHDARISNLQKYYEGLGWHGGPHWFVSRDFINEFSNPLRRGTHSPSFNATHFGIEMVGDYDREAFDSGDGAKVRDNAVFLMAALCRKFGWDPATVIKLHKEDPRTTHACPGRKVVKADVVARVKTEMEAVAQITAISAAQADKPQPTPADLRRRMAKAIVDFEARRDKQGRLTVYRLLPEDGGGTYEVAGINDRYHKVEVDKLVALIRSGRHQEAEDSVVEYIASYTDKAAAWSSDPGVQFYLRDCVFNRGAKGAARILQRAVGVEDDGLVGKVTKAAVAKFTSAELLLKLRAARENYERNVVGYRAAFWRGLVNRWNNALKVAQGFLP